MAGPVDVLSLRKLLPQGEVYDRTTEGETTSMVRTRTLVQLYTDPGGIRTLAAADIWTRNPGQYDTQW